MKKYKWIWMPHAGHFICSYKCQFHLNTYVGKYIVSTIGEMTNTDEFHDRVKTQEWETVGCDRKYETMVFKATKDKLNKCCPYAARDYSELDFDGYNTAEDAYKGHLKMCKKWSVK